ncbi:MAG TPA: ribbon-helix-helix domain-containing protein [Sphingomonas sp.]|nr:ribbon-helix-helix domain-containing protein [Sphingomonas sp.]
MSKSAVITARVDPDLSERLDALAGKLERSRAWIVAKAIERYVAEEAAFLDFLQVGIDAADRGDVISQEEMEQWFAERHRAVAAE